MLEANEFKRAILAIDTLGATPAVLAKVAKLTKDPNSDIETICALLRSDVGFDFAEAGAMLLKHWHFPAATCNAIRSQLNPEKVGQPATLLGALQFTRRLQVLTEPNLENQDWPFPATDPFVQKSGLTHELTSQLISTCRKNFQCILQSMDLN